jgi:hypothetical protein
MGVGPAAEILAGGQLCEGTMYYLFLKPEFTSQYPLPAKKGSKEPAAKATAPKQQGLKPTAGANDANK